MNDWNGFARECREVEPMMTPAPIAETGFVVVDATWGTIRPHTLAKAWNLPHDQAVERIDELARDQVTILFCNGPQCAATPDAVEALLAAGYPGGALAYYRGGLHDWQTLGLPVEAGSAESEASEQPRRDSRTTESVGVVVPPRRAAPQRLDRILTRAVPKS